MNKKQGKKHKLLTVHDIKFKDILKTSKGTILEVAFLFPHKVGWIEFRLKPRKKKR